MCTYLYVRSHHCVRLLGNNHICAYVTASPSSDVCLHSPATATAAGQSLREEQEGRAKAERQVQHLPQLKNGVTGDLPTLPIVIVCILIPI